MTLKKPSEILDNKVNENNTPIIESDNSFREELIKVESLSEQVTQLQQKLSQKVIRNDLESLVLSQINNMQENFDYLQNDFKKSNKKDIVEFKERVSELTEIVGNLVENELPKYKKQVTKNEVRIGDKFDELKEVVEENIVGIREEIDTQVNNIAKVIDTNLEYFNNQLQENSSEVKKTSDTYNKLSKILENKVLKESERNDLYINEKFVQLTGDIEENIDGIRTEVDIKVDNIKEVIDTNTDLFNTHLQETSSEIKKTTDTYNKIFKILENKVAKENDKLEEYSQVIQSLHESFVELQNSLQEETSTYNQIIEEKFETISSNVDSRIDSIGGDVTNIINNIDEKIDAFKTQVSSEVLNLKTDVVIFEKHNKDTEKTIQEFSEQLYKISEIDTNIININEDVGKLQNQYDSISNQSIGTKKDLEVVERYIQNYHHKLVELKEEVFGEIEQLPFGNIQENLERLEKKIDYIKETYSKIEPEVIVREVIKEGLLNIPPEEKTSDPLSPLNQNFVTLPQLQEHYRLFINRIQQQLSTIGGGGETRLEFLDDVDRTSAKVNGKFLKYDASVGKWVGATAGGGAGSQTLNDTLGLGNTSSLGMSVGVITATYFVGNGSLLTNVPGSSNSGYANNAGIATFATNAGVSTYATNAGIATFATSSGIATYATNAGIATYATNAGVSTYATNAGIATNIIGGIASVTQLNVSGISTVGFITASSAYVSGIITATQFSTGASGTGVNISTDTISGPSLLYIDPAAVGDNTGAVRIKGDLYVDGTQFIVNSTTIEFADFNVGIATTVGTNALLDGAGIGIGSTGIRKTIQWANSSSSLKSSENFNLNVGKTYKINGTDVLSNTTLGSGVVNSSLTSVGTLTNLSVGNVYSSGIVTTLSLRGYNSLFGTASSTTTTFVVTVASKTSNHRYFGNGSESAYFIDGIESPFLTLLPGKTYRFTQEDGSNSNHPILFYYQADKTTPYTTNITTTGTPGSVGAYTEIVVTDTTPVVLHYQCSNHAYMGNAAHFSSNVADTPYLITARSGINVTGDVTATSFVKSAGTSSQFLKADGSVDANTYITTTGSGTNLTGIVTSIVAGTNVTVSGSTGQVTINSSGGGGGSSQWVTTDVGIHTLSNVGIGTTNPTSKLTVVGVVSATSFSGSGAGLTSIPAGNLTGALPAIDGSALTGIVGSGSGIVIRDDGSLVGTATTIDFGANLSVSFASGIATITGSGGGGSQTLNDILGLGNTSSLGMSVGVVTATSFSGSGAGLTNIPANIGISYAISSNMFMP